jgi:hypothetical protein
MSRWVNLGSLIVLGRPAGCFRSHYLMARFDVDVSHPDLAIQVVHFVSLIEAEYDQILASIHKRLRDVLEYLRAAP